ncbi:MAG: serine/threonine protein kinase, partial [Gemmataceae bacterium]
AGGMGSVYLCEHMVMRRRVAIKVLPASKAEDPASLERFFREARAAAALDHPNIVRAYDIDREDNLHFLVMEYVDGANLQEIVKRTGPLEVHRAAHYIRQVALGLQHAHENAGLVHRDIKPGNVLVDRNGQVKLLDMGLARFFHDDEDELTKKYEETVLGTADYLAPEQALDSHGADIRADIYSLGATFYYCLLGKPPFAEGTVPQKLIWHQTREPKAISSLRPDVPEEMQAIIQKMMAKDRTERYQTPIEVVWALDPWTRGAIPPPSDLEIPRLSQALLRSTPFAGPGTDSDQRKSTPSPTSKPAPGDPQIPVSRTPSPTIRMEKPRTGASQVVEGAPGPESESDSILTKLPVRNEKAARPRSLEIGAVERPGANDFPPSDDLQFDIAPLRQKDKRPIKREVKKQNRSIEPSLGKRRNWLLIAAGLVLLVGTVVLLFILFGSKRTPRDSRESSGQQVHRVDGSIPGALSRTIEKARSGDRILVSGTIQETDVTVKKDDLTLEAEQGQTVHWTFPASASPSSKMLMIQSASSVRIKGIHFDGGNRCEAMIVLYGKCPGVTLDTLTLANPGKHGILVSNCEGSAEKPIVVNELHFELPREKVGMFFEIREHSRGAVPLIRHLRLQRSQFEGPGTPLGAQDPSKVDLTTLSLPNNLRITPMP